MRSSFFFVTLALGCSAADDTTTTTTADAASDTGAASEVAPDTMTATDTPTVEGATFDEVYAKVLNTSCGGGYCHGSGTGGWSVKDKDATYAELVGPASSQCTGLKRVEPGVPEKSALFLKVRGSFAMTCKGNQMPPGEVTLDAAQLESVRSWIAAGAKR